MFVLEAVRNEKRILQIRSEVDIRIDVALYKVIRMLYKFNLSSLGEKSVLWSVGKGLLL